MPPESRPEVLFTLGQNVPICAFADVAQMPYLRRRLLVSRVVRSRSVGQRHSAGRRPTS